MMVIIAVQGGTMYNYRLIRIYVGINFHNSDYIFINWQNEMSEVSLKEFEVLLIIFIFWILFCSFIERILKRVSLVL